MRDVMMVNRNTDARAAEVMAKLEEQGKQLETIQNADTLALVTPSDEVMKTLISEETVVTRENPYEKMFLIGRVVGRVRVTATVIAPSNAYKTSLGLYRNDVLIEAVKGGGEGYETLVVEGVIKENDVLKVSVSTESNGESSKVNLLTINGTTDIPCDEVFLDVFGESAAVARVESLTQSEQTAAAVEYLTAMAE